MTQKNLIETLVTVGSLYTRRFAERVYDGLSETAIGRRIASLDKGTQLGIEAGLYFLTAYFDKVFREDTPFRKYIKEVAMDAAPEVAKRMVNGTIRPELARLADAACSIEEQTVLRALLQLPDDSLADLLYWLAEMQKSKRNHVLSALTNLPAAQLQRFADLPAEHKGALLDLETDVATRPSRSSDIEKALAEAHSRVNASLQEQTNRRRH